MPRKLQRLPPTETPTKLGMRSKAEFRRQLKAARETEAHARRTQPRIVSARCAARGRFLEVTFTNGVTNLFPLWWFSDLRHASRRAINHCAIGEGGSWIHWEELDADYLAETLVESVTWMPPRTFERPDRPKLAPGEWSSRSRAAAARAR